MAMFEFSNKHDAWVKYCAGCDTNFIGAKSQYDSEVIFLGVFGQAKAQADGLQHYCKPCAKRERKRRKGVEDHDENELFQSQNGKCALCTIEIFLPYRFFADPQGARVDHDHKTGAVRGLLCHGCNILVGMYESMLERNPEFDMNVINKYIGLGQ